MGEFDGDIVVPDVAEPIRGWRAWDLEDLRLTSINVEMEWKAGPNQARCSSESWGEAHEHEDEEGPDLRVPNTACSCGFYSFKDLEYMTDGYYSGEVYGEILLWGQVIEGTKGWRSEYAQIVRLYETDEYPNSMGPVAEFYGAELIPKPDPDEALMRTRAEAARAEAEERRAKAGPPLGSHSSTVYAALQSMRDTLAESLNAATAISSLPAATLINPSSTNSTFTLKLGPGGNTSFGKLHVPQDAILNIRTNMFVDKDGFESSDGYRWRKRYG